MHLNKPLIVLTGILLCLIITFASAHANFYVVAGGGKKVGTEIKALPYTITQSGFYFITKNLICPSGSHGITIEASDVTIDLMGFALIGPRGTGSYCGIYSYDSVVGIEVRNGTIRNFNLYGYSAFSADSHGHRIINMRIRNNGDSGISLYSFNNLVKDCTSFSNQGAGILPGSGSTATGNTCYSNGSSGISTGKGCTITNNTCRDNTGNGIIANYGSTVIGNTCSSNGSSGISAVAGCIITNNTCRGNSSDGISTNGSCSITSNNCIDNGNHGIDAHIRSGVIGNTCISNSNQGINLAGNNYATQNTCYANGTINMNACGTCTILFNHTP